MIASKEWRWAASWALALVLVATLPYLIAYLTTPGDLFYTGFLSNPEDGHSYLAKMRQGWRGEWRFRLPFTPEPHQGEFLFTYYLALGHVARWTGLSQISILHFFRIVNGLFLLLVLYYAVSHFFHDVAQRRFAYLIIALGSGLGWLAVFLGGMTVDMWVPEGYIFYSMLVNAHFPLAIALMLLLLLWSVTPWGAGRVSWQRLVGLAASAAALGVVQPFSLLPVGVVLLGFAVLRWVQEGRLPWREIASGAVIGATGLPFALNAYLSTVRNPAFAGWSAQNQTPSPPPWNYALGYGVVLLLALFGMWVAARRRRESDVLLLTWTACTVALLYAPFSLQRRLVMGLIVPLGLLATMGWYALPARRRPRAAVAWGIASLSHLFLIGIMMVGVLSHDPLFFLTRDERGALQWLADHATPDALVIAAPQTGLYIPAWSGQRVLYGHRFETASADERREQLETFYRTGDGALFAPPLRADYVFYGPREQALGAGGWEPDPTWQTVYQQGAVTLYALPRE